MTNEDTLNPAPNPATPSGKRRGIAVGLAGGLLAGTAAGLVFGVPGLSSAASTDVTVSQAALVQQTDETDTTTEDVPAEMGARLRESLQELVNGGTITAEQADAVTAHLVENRPERGDGEGRGGHRGGPGMFGRGVASEALTDLLGIDGEELRTQLRAGATLAEIAAEQGDRKSVV